jgi:hypothetical protein
MTCCARFSYFADDRVHIAKLQASSQPIVTTFRHYKTRQQSKSLGNGVLTVRGTSRSGETNGWRFKNGGKLKNLARNLKKWRETLKFWRKGLNGLGWYQFLREDLKKWLEHFKFRHGD